MVVSGGTSPYNYHWSNSATTQNLSSITAATYTVTVTDNAGCTASGSVTLTQGTAIVPSLSGTNISCNSGRDGSASISASGGTTPYTYLWSGGATTTSITSLLPSTYAVTVTDNKSCIVTTSINITQPAAISAIIAGNDVSCNGGANGSANLTVSGSTSPYTYHWSNAATTQNLSGKSIGTYSVTVTDNKSCTATKLYTP